MNDSLDHAIEAMERRRAEGLADGEARDAEAERAEFLARYPFERFWPDLERRAERETAIERAVEATGERPRPAWSTRLLYALRDVLADRRFQAALALTALAVAVGGGWLLGARDGSVGGADGAPEGVRFKGGTVVPAAPGEAALGTVGGEAPVGVRFFVRRGDGALPGEIGAIYDEGAQIRFTYCSGDNDYLLLLSIEDSGTVSVYYPDEAGAGGALRSVPIVRGRNIPLEGAIELNDYVGDERFFALFSPMPLPVAHVRQVAAEAFERVRDEGDGVVALERLPVDVPQATFWIRKR